MTQEIIMAFLFGVFYGTAIRAGLDRPEFWQFVRKAISWTKQKLQGWWQHLLVRL